jgi:phage terminase large subunit-like protein
MAGVVWMVSGERGPGGLSSGAEWVKPYAIQSPCRVKDPSVVTGAHIGHIITSVVSKGELSSSV